MKKGAGYLSALGAAVSIGVNLTACIAAGVFVGYSADVNFGTLPDYTTVGFVLGAFIGCWVTYKKIRGA